MSVFALERWSIRGRLRERPKRFHSPAHARVEARLAGLLGNWLDGLPPHRGEIHSGDVRCRLRGDPESVVSMDLAYVSPEQAAGEAECADLIEGIPVLAVEVLEPWDVLEEVNEKIDEYRAVAVPLTWAIDPHFHTVTVYRPGAEPEMFNATQQLSGEPHLPGFALPVAKIFGR
jgi:Uma2 family endonuclease